MTARRSRGAFLNLPCQKCEKPIGKDGAFYLPYRERQRFHAAKQRQDEFEKRKRTESPGGLVCYNLTEMLEYTAEAMHWKIHCTPCMNPCIDHPDDSHCDGCGGSYWFYGSRADTWPKIANWTAHLWGKRWFADTNWDQVLHYLNLHNECVDA